MKTCLVTTDLIGPIKNGGVATACTLLAEFLARQYGSVDVLLVHLPTQMDKQLLEIWTYEYSLKNIKLIPFVPPRYDINVQHLYSALSYTVYHNLKNSYYDLILFPEMHGMAHYCLWAQQTGIAFQKTKLVVMYHGPREWHNKFNDSIPLLMSDLVVYHLEKESCRMANHIYFATDHSRKIAETLNYYSASTTASDVILYPFREPQRIVRKNKINKKITEICFFGRIETRKGVKTFLEALTLSSQFIIKNKIKISFLGPLGHIDPFEAKPYLEKWSLENSIPILILDNKDHDEAISYLRENNPLVVLASLEETMGYTLIECITYGIPFVCSDIGSFQEILKQFNLQAQNLSFKSEQSIDLQKLLIRKIKVGVQTPRFNFDVKKLEKIWIKSFEKIRRPVEQSIKLPINKSTAKNRLLSVCIVHKDRPKYLAQLLHSLSPLNSLIGEIQILDNGSSTIQAKKYIRSLEAEKKIKVLWNRKNDGPSTARNLLAEKSEFENILFIDDDNLLDANAFKRMYKNLRVEWDVLVAPLKMFNDSHLDTKNFFKNSDKVLNQLNNHVTAHQPPIGNDISLSLLENVNGDANFLVKKKHFLAIGGFDSALSYGEDQAFLIKSRIRGGIYLMCPEPFIYYRRHTNNLSSRNGLNNSNFAKLLKSVTRSANLPELQPFLLMMLGWRFEKRRNDHIHQLYEWKQSYKRSILLLDHQPIKNILKNQSLATKLSTCIVMNKNKPSHSQAVMKTQAHGMNIVLHIYTQKSGHIQLNDQPLPLQSGDNLVEVVLNPNKKIALYFKSTDLSHVYVKQYFINEIHN